MTGRNNCDLRYITPAQGKRLDFKHAYPAYLQVEWHFALHYLCESLRKQRGARTSSVAACRPLDSSLT